MQKHVKIYLKTFDNELCEVCGAVAVDIHHIHGRGKGKDVPENLIALCRSCHMKANTKELTREKIIEIHNKIL